MSNIALRKDTKRQSIKKKERTICFEKYITSTDKVKY